MSSPHHRGSEIAETTGGGKIGGRCSEAQRLEEKRQVEQASPIAGGIYEAQAAAEPGESVVFKTIYSLSGSDTGGVIGASVGVLISLSHQKRDRFTNDHSRQATLAPWRTNSLAPRGLIQLSGDIFRRLYNFCLFV